ncbi:MAG: DNA polymerase Y family protein [Tepidiformaceae bacterium]
MEVACFYVEEFSVAIARRDDPRLRKRPVVIGGSPDEHAAVTGCSREAAEAGVTVGMPLRRALALCPKAVFLPLQEGAIVAEWTRLTDLLCRLSPSVEAIAPGHAHFDTRGLACMAGLDDETWVADLHESACTSSGLPVRIAAADTVFAAHAAAITLAPRPETERARGRKGERAMEQTLESLVAGSHTRPFAPSAVGWVVVPEGLSREYLGTLPVEVLPVPPQMHQKLRRFGLNWLGQVAALPFSAMQAQFGHDGARAWELANGHDYSAIVPRREEVRITEGLDLPAATALSEPLVVGTRVLLQKALQRREVRGQSLRRLDWKLGLESGEQLTRRTVFREPTNDAARMLFALRGKIERLQLPAAAVSLEVTLSGLCSEYGHQSNLWPIGPRRHRELLEAIEQLNTREGDAQVFRIVEVQPWSRIPERQLALVAFGP